MTPYQLVFSKACYFHIELVYKIYLVVKTFNFDHVKAKYKKKLDLLELE